MQGRLIEQVRIVPAILPVNTTGAAQTGVWVSLKDYRRLLIVINQGAWAGGTPAVTLQQAQDASGTGAKALAFDTMYQSTLAADVPTVNTVTGNTFNLPAVANTQTCIEIHSQDLDVSTFGYVALLVASPGGNADYISADYLLYEAGFSAKPSTLRTVLT